MKIRAMKSLLGWACLVLVSGCAASVSSGPRASEPAASKPSAKSKPSVVSPETAPVPVGAKLIHTLEGVGFEAPEAVLYDTENDFYLVSNVNGAPLSADANGFISKVSPEGKVLELKWIDGAKAGVTLDAPKGMAISGPYLYVSDITWIRVFDRKTGAPKGKIHTQATTFLNDVEAAPNGDVYFSDTGWKNGKDGFESTGSDGVFRIDPKSVSAKEVVRSKELGNPNGLAATEEGVWVVNDQGELFRVEGDGKRSQNQKLAKGGLDGVVALEDGSLLVSSWEGGAIYHGKPGGEFEVLVGDLKSPASIGFDTKRGRVLVPKMMEDRVLVYSMPGTAPAEVKSSAPKSEPVAPAVSAPAAKKQPPAASKKPMAQSSAKADKKAPTLLGKPAKKKPASKKAAPASRKPAKTKALGKKPAPAAGKPAKPKPLSKKAAPAKPLSKTAAPAKPLSKKAAPAKPLSKKPAPAKAKKKSEKPAPVSKKATPAPKPASRKAAPKAKPASKKAKAPSKASSPPKKGKPATSQKK